MLSINCLSAEKNQQFKKIKSLESLIDYPQAIDDVYENLENYNPTKK